jgi:hypothetical protein
MFTKDDIHTIVDIVIINPMRIGSLPQSCATQGFVTFGAAQAKKRSYPNFHPFKTSPITMVNLL